MPATVFPAPGSSSGVQWATYSITETASSSGTTVTIVNPDAISRWVGLSVVVASGTGSFASNTIITSVISTTQFTVSITPTLDLSGATITISNSSMNVISDNIKPNILSSSRVVRSVVDNRRVVGKTSVIRSLMRPPNSSTIISVGIMNKFNTPISNTYVFYPNIVTNRLETFNNVGLTATPILSATVGTVTNNIKITATNTQYTTNIIDWITLDGLVITSTPAGTSIATLYFANNTNASTLFPNGSTVYVYNVNNNYYKSFTVLSVSSTSITFTDPKDLPNASGTYITKNSFEVTIPFATQSIKPYGIGDYVKIVDTNNIDDSVVVTASTYSSITFTTTSTRYINYLFNNTSLTLYNASVTVYPTANASTNLPPANSREVLFYSQMAPGKRGVLTSTLGTSLASNTRQTFDIAYTKSMQVIKSVPPLERFSRLQTFDNVGLTTTPVLLSSVTNISNIISIIGTNTQYTTNIIDWITLDGSIITSTPAGTSIATLYFATNINATTLFPLGSTVYVYNVNNNYYKPFTVLSVSSTSITFTDPKDLPSISGTYITKDSFSIIISFATQSIKPYGIGDYVKIVDTNNNSDSVVVTTSTYSSITFTTTSVNYISYFYNNIQLTLYNASVTVYPTANASTNLPPANSREALFYSQMAPGKRGVTVSALGTNIGEIIVKGLDTNFVKSMQVIKSVPLLDKPSRLQTFDNVGLTTTPILSSSVTSVSNNISITGTNIQYTTNIIDWITLDGLVITSTPAGTSIATLYFANNTTALTLFPIGSTVYVYNVNNNYYKSFTVLSVSSTSITFTDPKDLPMVSGTYITKNNFSVVVSFATQSIKPYGIGDYVKIVDTNNIDDSVVVTASTYSSITFTTTSTRYINYLFNNNLLNLFNASVTVYPTVSVSTNLPPANSREALFYSQMAPGKRGILSSAFGTNITGVDGKLISSQMNKQIEIIKSDSNSIILSQMNKQIEIIKGDNSNLISGKTTSVQTLRTDNNTIRYSIIDKFKTPTITGYVFDTPTIGNARSINIMRGIPGADYKFDVQTLRKSLTDVKGIPGADYKFDAQSLQKQIQILRTDNNIIRYSIIDKFKTPPINGQVFETPTISVTRIINELRELKNNIQTGKATSIQILRTDNNIIRYSIIDKFKTPPINGQVFEIPMTYSVKTINVVRGIPGADYKFDVQTLRKSLTDVKGIPGADYKFDVQTLRKSLTDVKGIPGADYKFDIQSLQKQIQILRTDNNIIRYSIIDKFKTPPINGQVFETPTISVTKTITQLRETPNNIQTGNARSINIMRGIPGADYKFDTQSLQKQIQTFKEAQPIITISALDKLRFPFLYSEVFFAPTIGNSTSIQTLRTDNNTIRYSIIDKFKTPPINGQVFETPTIGNTRSINKMKGIPGADYKFDVQTLRKSLVDVKGIPGADYKFDIQSLQKKIFELKDLLDNIRPGKVKSVQEFKEAQPIITISALDKLRFPFLYSEVFFPPTIGITKTINQLNSIKHLITDGKASSVSRLFDRSVDFNTTRLETYDNIGLTIDPFLTGTVSIVDYFQVVGRTAEYTSNVIVYYLNDENILTTVPINTPTVTLYVYATVDVSSIFPPGSTVRIMNNNNNYDTTRTVISSTSSSITFADPGTLPSISGMYITPNGNIANISFARQSRPPYGIGSYVTITQVGQSVTLPVLSSSFSYIIVDLTGYTTITNNSTVDLANASMPYWPQTYANPGNPTNPRNRLVYSLMIPGGRVSGSFEDSVINKLIDQPYPTLQKKLFELRDLNSKADLTTVRGLIEKFIVGAPPKRLGEVFDIAEVRKVPIQFWN